MQPVDVRPLLLGPVGSNVALMVKRAKYDRPVEIVLRRRAESMQTQFIPIESSKGYPVVLPEARSPPPPQAAPQQTYPVDGFQPSQPPQPQPEYLSRGPQMAETRVQAPAPSPPKVGGETGRQPRQADRGLGEEGREGERAREREGRGGESKRTRERAHVRARERHCLSVLNGRSTPTAGRRVGAEGAPARTHTHTHTHGTRTGGRRVGAEGALGWLPHCEASETGASSCALRADRGRGPPHPCRFARHRTR